MIELVEVEKHFEEFVVIPPLTLTIHEGEFLTLLGPSGCGKTTLLRMIAGFEEPTRGKIFIDGREITSIPPYRRDVNMVFQNYALFPHLTVEENIGFGLLMKKVPKEERKRRIEEVLELTQLTEYRYRKPSQLSGGQQQRVAIARAIINKPKVLLLDEPMGALDLQLRKTLQMELKQLQKRLGMTFVYVTHDQEEAMAMSDRIVVMNQGRVEQIGTPEEIYYHPKTVFAASFIGENNFFRKGDLIIGVRPEKIMLYDLQEQGRDYPSIKKTGIIEDVIFMGNLYKLLIRLEDENRPLIAYQRINGTRKFSQREPVGIGWDIQDEVVLSQ